MICIYHSKDLDGYTSGAIVKRKYPDAKLIGYDYGQPLEIEATGEPIIMVDVSVPMATMLKLAQMSNFQFTWIDHHVSAINDYKQFTEGKESFCVAILEDGISACEGAWKYLFPNEEMPEAVELLGEYDTWRNGNKIRWENHVLPFQFGMRQICNSPETFPDYLLEKKNTRFGQDVLNVIRDGKLILSYQAMINESQCKRAAFESTLGGLRAICLNGGGLGSDTFKSVYDETKHDLMIPFQFNGKFWTVSLYTTKDEVDCSAIAKSMGGGGHKKAAGFQVSDIATVFTAIKTA